MQSFKQRLIGILDYAEANLVAIGLLGLVGFPMYFFIWEYFFPQPYENIGLRLLCSALFAPWVFYEKICNRHRIFFSMYFILSSFVVMPFFFSFMLLKNAFSMIWSMSYITGLCLLVIVIYDWFLVCLMSVLGLVLAGILLLIVDGAISTEFFRWDYLPVCLFALIGCLIACHRHKVDRQLKTQLMRSLAGSIAHEMRNPLAQIHGSLYLIQEQLPEATAKPAVGQHLDSAQRVIDNALQVIDITLNAVREKPIDCDSFQLLSARSLVTETVADYAYEDSDQAERVSVQGQDFSLLSDPVMVKYVLYNLMQNALFSIKAQPEAQLVIQLIASDQANCIEVRDTGPGIAPKALAKLFDSFYTSGKQGGTGLGLSYCKRSMTALGGDIRCDSELGQYTAFTLSFPVTTQQAPPVSPDKTLNTATNSLSTAPCSLVGKTILLAEDSRLNRLVVTAILESQGVRCVEAVNGRAALDLWSTRHFDLVLTDLQMPFMDGLALARAIRESETSSASSSPVPIIALTSESGDSIEVARQSGVNAILAKPVSADSLIPKLQQWLAINTGFARTG